jgi:cytochrome P450
MTETLSIANPEFWHQPLAARMAHFAELRAAGPFTEAGVLNPLSGEEEVFYAVTRYAELVEISRRPQDFCSGRGSIADRRHARRSDGSSSGPITMDDPRYARQRHQNASFTPRQLQGVLDSDETICTEVIDDMCEKGEVDLVEAISAPFPLLVICDMMGIPRSEFTTVLNATNVILGAGDPDMLGGQTDIISALFDAGMQLTMLMNDLAEHRRAHPVDDLTSALVHNDVGEEMLAPHEIAPFFILLAVAGNDTTRTATSIGMNLLAENPTSGGSGRTTLKPRHAVGSRRDRPRRVAGHVHAPHGDPRPHVRRARLRRRRSSRALLRRGEP